MDSSLYRWINRLADQTGWSHGLSTTNAGYGIALFAFLLLVTYLDGRRHDDLTAVAASVWAGAAALVALGIGQLIGGAADRLRPYETMTNVHVLTDKTTYLSFPSDHATAAGAVAVGLLFANGMWGIVAAAGWFTVVPGRRRLAAWLAGTPLRPLVTHAERPAVSS